MPQRSSRPMIHENKSFTLPSELYILWATSCGLCLSLQVPHTISTTDASNHLATCFLKLKFRPRGRGMVPWRNWLARGANTMLGQRQG
ncbi:hypothetical protein BDW66DRAFT_143413 [Aspergillus desertorum]